MANIVATGQRPVVSEDELNNYVNALPGLWAEACDADAIEVATGECEVPLDTQNFDLSEVVASLRCMACACGTTAVSEGVRTAVFHIHVCCKNGCP